MEGGEAPCEFVCNSCAAEFSEWVLRIRSARVDDGERIGHVAQVCGWVVVVCDDEVDVEVFCDECWGGCGDAAIHGDDDLGALFCECADGVVVEAVAFFDAVGDVGGDLCVWRDDCEHVVEDGACGDAVDIVISEDDDGFVVLDGFQYALGGFVEVWDE